MSYLERFVFSDSLRRLNKIKKINKNVSYRTSCPALSLREIKRIKISISLLRNHQLTSQSVQEEEGKRELNIGLFNFITTFMLSFQCKLHSESQSLVEYFHHKLIPVRKIDVYGINCLHRDRKMNKPRNLI